MSADIVAHPSRDAPVPKPVADRTIIQELESMLMAAKRGDVVNLAVTYVDGKGYQYTRIVCEQQMLTLHSGVSYLMHRMNKFMEER